MSTISHILSLPFRRSTPISLSSTIRQYINTKYDQHPEMFRQDLEAIDVLRREAVNVREPHASGIAKLQAYAAQLAWIGGKFPIDIGAEFTWYPALGYNPERPMVRNNLKFELLNILYNLAALYSQLAVAQSRGGPEGVKTAVSYFSRAAGVLSHMQQEVLPELRMSDPPDDMDMHTLEALKQLLLAQCQECFWKKAVMDGTYKDASIARLAARVSDLYNLAIDSAMKSEAISSAWIHHMSAKHHHFAGAAQYRAACDCLEKKKFGEEVARLADAVACVNEGLKENRGGYLNKIVLEDLQGLKRRVEEDLKRAERDNDKIYMQAVPCKPELTILDRADMAKAMVPPQVANPFEYLGDHAEFGPALFTKLVPFAVHAAITIYEQRRDRLVNQSVIQAYEDLTEKLHSMLSSLNLPGSLQALEKPLGLPPNLIHHAEEIRQADAVGRIQRAFSDIDKLRSADHAVFAEGKAILAAEEEEDVKLRTKYGTDRWTRPDSRSDPQGGQLWAQVDEIEGYFKTSISSDEVVQNKFTQVQDLLELMSGSDRMLMDYVPSSRRVEIPDGLRPVIGRLRGAYNDVLRLESRRRRRVDALRDKCRGDDIKPEILKEAARLERTYPTTAILPVHFEEFFERRLDALYEPELEAVEKDATEQERLAGEVERISREFEGQRRSMTSGNREREQALQRLDNAYYKYKEIVNHLDVGRKFYNDLSKVVGQNFRDPVRAWAAERRMDAKSLEEYPRELNMPTLGSLSISNRTPVHSPPLNYHSGQQQQQQQPPTSYFPINPVPPPVHDPRQQVVEPSAESAVQSWASPTVEHQQPQLQPHPQPVSTASGMWTPDIGIRFAGTPQGATPTGPPGPNGGLGANTQASRHHASGTWDPSREIRFG
ncbi:BRO1-like domain-containing protein [Sodiomyces alkalinus F11]|uniref:BRO1-like domain-containing protein n=1 Tax=Sodiomyces alkalinus (strain CBS 110278 / VKM F-3762 / F11) TaxID=1314773 RepID=A0A3N2PL13_SODAK|nr:BRO1-like domain-containing protein [Sodiomyces alkalinus F11]ROT35110.1 BRO1-like domain-containing protein [Sodiomyces alkalinus F11]